MLIAVATPYGAHLEHPEVMRRVEFLKSRMLNCKFVTAEISMHIVSLARTKLVEQCLVAGADAIFFVDSDVLIPENAYILFDHLSDEHPVVSGLYVHRHPPHLPQAYVRATNHVNGKHPYLPVVNVGDTPRSVDGVGAGCLLVRSDVFGKLKDRHEAYLQTIVGVEYGDSGLAEAVHYASSLGPWFEFLGNVGEDFYFCEQLSKIGIRPWLVPEVQCQHIGQVAFGIEHFTAALAQGLVHTADYEQ